MKSILLVVGLLLGSIVANAQVEFFDGNWQEAAKKAQEEEKYLFVDCYTDWCHWCKVADSTTFKSEQVGAVMKKLFVSVKVDMERDEGIYLGMKYRVFGYPTFLVFDPDGRLLFSQFGYISDESEFIETLKEGTSGERQFKYQSKLNGKVDFPEFYKATFTDANSKKKRKFAEPEVVSMWLSKQEDLTTEAAWGVMRRFDTDEKINRRFFHELETYRNLYGKVEVNSKIVDIASKSFNEALKKEGSTEDDMLPAYMLIDKFLDEEMKQPTKMQFRLRFAEVKEDWRLYAKVVTQLLSKEKIKTNPGQANDYGWKLYLKCDDQVVLGEAVMWMSKAVRVKPDYAGMDTYAALLYKTGAYDEALVAAANAIELGLKEEQKVGETKELVDKIKAAQKGK